MIAGRNKRGERKALRLLEKLNDAGIPVIPVKLPGQGWGMANPSRDDHTPEQRAVVQEAMLFCIGYPRCFGTMLRLVRDRQS